MASKVNTKFVLALVGGVVVLFGGIAGTYLYIQARSGERNIRLGDAAMARGDYKAADILYSKAVNRDQTNIAWLTKWRDAKLKSIPTTSTTYGEEYINFARGMLRQIAIAKRTDIEAHKDYLGEIYTQLTQGNSSRQGWQLLSEEADSAIRYFEPNQPVALRRLRGIALANWASQDPQMDPAKRDQAQADLEAVLKETPSDTAAAIELVLFYGGTADAARAAGRRGPAAEAEGKMRETLKQVMAQNPTAGDVKLVGLILDATDGERSIDQGKPIGEVVKARNAMLERLKPRIEDVRAMLASGPIETLTQSVIGRFTQIASRLDPAGAGKATLTLVERALAAKPTSAPLLMLKADAQLRSNDQAGMQTTLGKIVELPNLPLSYDGLQLWGMRARARFMQANIASVETLQAATVADRAAAIERTKVKRTALALEVPEDSPQLTLIDARIAAASADPRKAQALLEKFLKAPGDAADQEDSARLLLADMCARVNEPGRARALLMEVENKRGSSPELALARADLELQLRNFPEAIRLYEVVLAVAPGNERAIRNREIARGLNSQGGDQPAQIDDPVTRSLVEYGRISREKGPDAALAALEASIAENKFDPRMVQLIMGEFARRNEVERAKAIISKALAARPDEKMFQDIKRGIDSLGSVETMLALVDANQSLTPVQKELARVDVYTNFNKPDEARKALEAAEKINPADPVVLDRLLTNALNDKKLDAADAIVQRATAANADQAGGDTFGARVALTRGDNRGAANLLQRAVDRGNAPVVVHRLLGQVLASEGRTRDAVVAFKRAYDLNPSDPETVKLYVAMLGANGQRQEALALARQAEPMMRGDAAFQNMALNLEANVGDGAVAKARRLALDQSNPKDLDNAAALAELHINDKEFEKARVLIDRIKAARVDLRTTVLEATWFASQAQNDKANETFASYIKGLEAAGELKTAEPILTHAQFLTDRGFVDAGIAVGRQARKFQDPVRREVDRALAETQLRYARFADAETTLREMISTNIQDDDKGVAKRLIEALIQQEKHAEAKAEIAKLGSKADEDLELLLQRAQIARSTGDRREARTLLDKAVQAFPADATPYVRRARLQMSESGSERDAIDDLNTALKVQPTLWTALQNRGKLRIMLGQTNDGLKDLEAAMEAAPTLDDLRYDLVRQLLKLGKEGDAVNIAEAGKKLRPNDVNYLNRIGQIFAAAGLWNRAVPYYRDVYRISSELGSLPYVQTLLASTPPAVSEAESVLRAPGVKVDGNSTNLLVRAAIRRHQKKDAEARGDVRASLSALNSSQADALNNWYIRFRQIFRDSASAMSVIEGVKTNTVLDQWLDLWRTQILIQDQKTVADGIEIAKRLIAANPVAEVKSTAYLALTNALIVTERFEEAVKYLEEGVKVAPDEPVMLNNLGYLLATKFNRAPEAVAIADRLFEQTRDVAMLNDTTATIYWEAGQRDKAIEIQSRAARTAPSLEDGIRYRLKLAKWFAEAGNKASARVQTETIAEFLVETPSMRETIQPELERLRETLKN